MLGQTGFTYPRQLFQSQLLFIGVNDPITPLPLASDSIKLQLSRVHRLECDSLTALSNVKPVFKAHMEQFIFGCYLKRQNRPN